MIKILADKLTNENWTPAGIKLYFGQYVRYDL